MSEVNDIKHLFSEKVLTVILLISIITVTCFIFINSSKNGVESNEQSDDIVAVVKPIVDPENHLSYDFFSFFVRKTAHFGEFFLLGILWILLKLLKGGKFSFFIPLFAVLATAVADETIQIYSGRTSSVSDVIIDFSGGLLAVLLITALKAVFTAYKRKQRTHEN